MTYRRAKLKRVTQDDRDNIVRSRALPENFDLSSALQSPFGLPQRHSAQPVSPTSHSSSSNSDRAARSPVPATTQVDQHHGGLACPFVGTPSQPTADQLSPLPQEICRPFGIFLPTGFQVIEEEVSTSYVLDNTSCPPQAQTPSHQPPPTPQTCDFYTSPLDSSFGSMSPDMNSYGLGFSCKISIFPSRLSDSRLIKRRWKYSRLSGFIDPNSAKPWQTSRKSHDTTEDSYIIRKHA